MTRYGAIPSTPSPQKRGPGGLLDPSQWLKVEDRFPAIVPSQAEGDGTMLAKSKFESFLFAIS